MNVAPQWELDEAYNLIPAIKRHAPGALGEIFDPEKAAQQWVREPSGLLTRKHQVKLDGPITHALMTAFTAKLGMALFAEHVGSIMPAGSGVYTQFYFNAGLDPDTAKANLSILPIFGDLRQGRKSSGPQFRYRYNTDLKSILGVFAGFHSKLHVRAFATAETEKYRFLLDEYNSGFVPFGGLPEMAAKWAPGE